MHSFNSFWGLEINNLLLFRLIRWLYITGIYSPKCLFSVGSVSNPKLKKNTSYHNRKISNISSRHYLVIHINYKQVEHGCPSEYCPEFRAVGDVAGINDLVNFASDQHLITQLWLVWQVCQKQLFLVRLTPWAEKMKQIPNSMNTSIFVLFIILAAQVSMMECLAHSA